MSVEKYIAEHGEELSRLCVRLCGDTLQAEDLYQETWMKVIKNIGRYDPGKDFRTWLFSICTNTYRDMYRRSRQEKKLITHSEKVLMHQTYDTECETDYARLSAAMDRLPERLREALVLRYFSSLDEKQVAFSLGISHAAARKRISRGIMLLKKFMEERK